MPSPRVVCLGFIPALRLAPPAAGLQWHYINARPDITENGFAFPRSLDLTGPLLLGGVPNLPEDFPVHSRQFVGCMRNLSIDGRVVDMAAFIANNGTRAGRHSPWVFRTSMVPTEYVWSLQG